MYRLQDYQYELPAGFIAQVPGKRRDASRMMVLHRNTGRIEHRSIADLQDYLHAGELVVVNDTRVVPARLVGRKESGGRVEVLVLHPAIEQGPYHCLIKAGKAPKPGTQLLFAGGVKARVCDPVVEGQTRVEFPGCRGIMEILENAGRVPLPPYIRRDGSEPEQIDDALAYQTVYARQPGAVAAPTAGLHLSEALLEGLRQKGLVIAGLTLHVGFGTFQPVRAADIRKHCLHKEFFEIPQETALAVNEAKENGRRVVAVGTTTVRALEFAAHRGRVEPGGGWCGLYIYPGYRFQVIDALLTNFHLPGSSLIILAAAWAGRSLLLKAYSQAIRQRYRFYSYGDAMFIE
ncbi:MAG: tRNA preQ1(34) S-adenosylmethionine ribosyltransferase-isomerase QueA [Syntrophobacteria bacterium]